MTFDLIALPPPNELAAIIFLAMIVVGFALVFWESWPPCR